MAATWVASIKNVASVIFIYASIYIAIIQLLTKLFYRHLTSFSSKNIRFS